MRRLLFSMISYTLPKLPGAGAMLTKICLYIMYQYSHIDSNIPVVNLRYHTKRRGFGLVNST